MKRPCQRLRETWVPMLRPQTLEPEGGSVRGNTFRARCVTVVAGATCLALLLSACGGGSVIPKADGGGIILAASTEPQNPLLPTNTNEVGGVVIMKLLFEGLISYDAQGKSINQVAESITTTGSQTFTIKLKPGWKFTNGEPVDAKSFVDAWNFGALITNAQLNAYFFEPIDGYTEIHPAADGAKPTATTMKGLAVLDDSTFTARLTSAQASFPMRLGYTAFYPLPQSAYKDIKAFGQSPVGNGSYMMDGKWVHNVSIKVKKNPGYKGTLVAKNAGVDVMVYTDPNESYADLLANDVDVVQGIPDRPGQFQGRPGESGCQPACGYRRLLDLPALRASVEDRRQQAGAPGDLDGQP